MTIYDTDEDYKAHQAKTMLGTRKNPLEGGYYKLGRDGDLGNKRYKLPNGWVLSGLECFIPFAEDGTGWGKNDPVDIAGEAAWEDPLASEEERARLRKEFYG